jgi:hypothetical protein
LPSHRATPHQGSAARSRVTAESRSKLLEENRRERNGRERNGIERNGKERVGSHDIAVYKERKVEEKKKITEFCIALLAVDSPDYNKET